MPADQRPGSATYLHPATCTGVLAAILEKVEVEHSTVDGPCRLTCWAARMLGCMQDNSSVQPTMLDDLHANSRMAALLQCLDMSSIAGPSRHATHHAMIYGLGLAMQCLNITRQRTQRAAFVDCGATCMLRVYAQCTVQCCSVRPEQAVPARPCRRPVPSSSPASTSSRSGRPSCNCSTQRQKGASLLARTSSCWHGWKPYDCNFLEQPHHSISSIHAMPTAQKEAKL